MAEGLGREVAVIVMTDVARSRAMGDVEEDRGAAIRERVEALGISEREFAAESHIDRKTLRRAMESDPTVRPSTFGAIESALGRLEDHARARVSSRPIGDPSEDMIELEFEESPGRRVVIKGPAGNLDQMEASLARLIAAMRDDSDKS